MKIYISQKDGQNFNNVDIKDMLVVKDKDGKVIGKILAMKNVSLSIGDVSLVIGLDETIMNNIINK
jgi:hypothetical protein